ncbi:unnamed protein product [Larinioides sclopetarius]|uniref:Uncharacterized protein n=1 Tax=Larinioides sclopetarius TaxID=280406 RepID=A0AAV2BPI8_9ARAC
MELVNHFICGKWHCADMTCSVYISPSKVESTDTRKEISGRTVDSRSLVSPNLDYGF